MKPASPTTDAHGPFGSPWCDVAVVQCTVGTLEVTGPNIPAFRLRVQSGQEHDFCLSSIADLALLGEMFTRHAARLAAIAATADRPH